MNKQHIPQTDSIEELAKFWDTHDLTDFEEHFQDKSWTPINLRLLINHKI